jgi:hypothetical protein
MVGMAMSGWLERSWQAYRLILSRSLCRCEMRKPASMRAWMKVDRLARIPFAAAHNAKIFSLRPIPIWIASRREPDHPARN